MTRAREARRALDRLGPVRALAFLRAISRDADSCLAVKLVNEHLDKGATLEAIFLDGEEFGFTLHAKRVARDRFQIAFGCSPGPMIGDGGEWDVRFGQDGAVLECVAGMVWMS